MVVRGRLLVIFAGVLCSLHCIAQTVDTAFWVPNGKVESLVLHDTTVIIGGDFDQVSPITGSFVRLDTVTARFDSSLFKVNGSVYAICRDSNGYVYVGGSFTRVGGQAVDHLFRLTPAGTFDNSFSCPVDGPVYALCYYNTDIYIGGSFSSINGETRNNCGSINVDTGGVNVFDPNVNGPVYCIKADTMYNCMILGGDFTGVGAFSPPYIAKVFCYLGQPWTFSAVPWSANPNADGPVYDIEIIGNRVIIGGEFLSFGAVNKRGLAKLILYNGSVVADNALVNGSVYDIVTIDSTIYLGGLFNAVGQTPRQNLANVDFFFNLQNWKPSTDGVVKTMTIMGDSSRFFVGGDFVKVNGDTCQRGALITFNDTGTAANWNPMINHRVRASYRDTSGRLYVGGEFFGAGGVIRNNLCALSVNSGKVTGWNPDVSHPVRTITLDEDTLYFAGDFSAVGGIARGRIASIDLGTSTLTPFNPGVNGLVRTIEVTDSVVYFGGNFTTLGGQPRQNIGKVDKYTSLARPWNPGCLGTVNSIHATPAWIYVAGFYNTIAGVTRQNLARLQPVQGYADWNWICDTDDGIYQTEFYNGKMVLGGWFSTVNGTPASDFVYLDTASLQVTTPAFACDGFVSRFTNYGDDFFLAGMFDIVNAQYKPRLAAFDDGNNAVDTWSPLVNSTPESMQATSTRLYAGGAMTSCGSTFHPFLQVISIQWVTGLDETQTQNAFDVYPVPATDFITVKADGMTRYEITDIAGKIVRTGTLDGTTENSISIAELAPGAYVLTLRDENDNASSQKIIRN